jgi:hypothetical protein
MAVDTAYGSRIMTGLLVTVPAVLADPGEGGGKVRKWVETVETDASATTGSLYTMARLPSNARIHGSSRIYNDALGSATATMSWGMYNTSSRTEFTNSTTGLTSGLITSSASTVGRPLVGDVANYGKRLYELAGLSADPKCEMDIKMQLASANLSSGAGTVTVEIEYSTD